MRTSRRGFTLIELLVVIAIIAILAAILFPVFAKAREKARQSSCSSNTKQLMLAFIQYIQDFDEKIPGRAYGVYPHSMADGQSFCWGGMIYPYVKNAQLFMCPSYDRRYTQYAWNGANRVSIDGNMGYNFCGAGGSTHASYPLAGIAQPTTQVMVADSVCPGLKSTGSDARNCLYIGPGTNTTSYPDNIHPRMKVHNEGINVGFLDGHVKWNKSASVPRGTFWARKIN